MGNLAQAFRAIFGDFDSFGSLSGYDATGEKYFQLLIKILQIVDCSPWNLRSEIFFFQLKTAIFKKQHRDKIDTEILDELKLIYQIL